MPLAVHEICSVEAKRTGDDSTVMKWFQRFKFGDSNTEDMPKLGCTSTTNDEALCQAVEDNVSTSTLVLRTSQPSSALLTAQFSISMIQDSEADSPDLSHTSSCPSKLLMYVSNCQQIHMMKGFSVVSSLEMTSGSSWNTPTLVPSDSSSQTSWQRWLFNEAGLKKKM